MTARGAGGVAPGGIAATSDERASAAALRDSGRAWLDMTLAAVSMFTVFAVAYSFGTFVKPMSAEFHASRGATALVFGVTAFAYFGLGALTGPLVHRVGPRAMVIVGGVVLVIGVLLTSRVHAMWQAYVTYGLGVGIGVACCYVPMVAVVGGWFERRRNLAIGIAVSGIGFSSLFGAPIAARLIKAQGWRHAYQVIAIAAGVLLAVVAALVRTPPGFNHAPSMRLGEAVRSRLFALSYFAALLCSIPLFSVFVNLVPYAEDHGIKRVTAATLLSLIGGASIVGRNGLALLARRVGTPVVYAASFGGMAVTQLLWLGSGHHYGLLALFALLFGFSYGGFISLSPVMMAELFGPEQMGGLIGINYSAAGIGALFGPTIGAWLVDRTGTYSTTIVLGCACGVAATGLLWMLARTADSARAATPARATG